MNIGFLYYNFYPVEGGASVHGYHLAKELNKLGHTLFKLNGEPDPFTVKLPQSPAGLKKLIRSSDILYVRVDYFLNSRNLAGLAALISGKRVVVELNSPSDELALRGHGKMLIRNVDRLYRFILKRAAAVITVSEPVKEYCKTALGLNKVYVVENGGEIFEPVPEKLAAESEVLSRFSEIRKKAEKVAVWAGSTNRMQNFRVLREVASKLDDQTHLLMIVNEEPGSGLPDIAGDRAVVVRNAGRSEVGGMISRSDIGIALYDEYSWSRWGFYNSSLKIYEYLNNGLLTISNVPGSQIQTKYSNFSYIPGAEAIAEAVNRFTPRTYQPEQPRTWKVVAEEVSDILNDAL